MPSLSSHPLATIPSTALDRPSSSSTRSHEGTRSDFVRATASPLMAPPDDSPRPHVSMRDAELTSQRGTPAVIRKPLARTSESARGSDVPLATRSPNSVDATASASPPLRDGAVVEMLERLRATIDNAHQAPQRQQAVSFLTRALDSLDVVRALTTRDDTLIRANPQVRVALGGARDILDHLREVMAAHETRLPPSVAKALRAHWKAADWNLKDFSHDASLTSRITALTAVRALNTFVFLGVPLAERQRKTTALYVASASKSLVRAVGLGRRATTHGWQVWEHFVGRDLINTQQSLLFAIHLIGDLMGPGPARERLEQHTSASPYLAFVGVASVISAMLAFHHKDLSQLLNKLFHGNAEPNLQGRETLGDQALKNLAGLRDRLFSAAKACAAPTSPDAPRLEDLPDDVRAALQHLESLAGEASDGVHHLGQQMRGLGQLSDSSGKLFGTVEGAFDQLHRSLATVLGMPAPHRTNDQWLAKSVLAVFALGVCAAPAAFLKDNAIGFIDLVANAGFVFLVMAMNAANPHTALEVSEDDFGQYCGFSLAMLGVWTYNNAKHDPMEKSWASAMHGAAVLSALGNTLAAPSGTAVGWLAAKANRTFARASTDVSRATANADALAVVTGSGDVDAQPQRDLAPQSISESSPAFSSTNGWSEPPIPMLARGGGRQDGERGVPHGRLQPLEINTIQQSPQLPD